MKKNLIILGKNGQLGRALVARAGEDALAFGRDQVNLEAPDFIVQLEHALAGRPCAAIINATAYTQVDKAEGEGREAAFRVNAQAVAELAQWCAAKGIPLVHVSTDYVFDGSGDTPWREEDATAPLNVYGQSKRAGEEAVLAAGGDALVFRTSWVFDESGKNFMTTMLRLFREKPTLNIVSDQIGAPTYAGHLAEAILLALKAALALPVFPSGVYHLCAGGETSWYEFAKTIFALAIRQDSSIICNQIHPIPSSAYPVPARRPRNSRLCCDKAETLLGVRLPRWEEGLTTAIRNDDARSGLLQ